MLIFFLLGLLSFPSRIPHVIVPALLIAVWLTFIARPVAVSTVLTPFKSKLSQQLLVSWSGLRGAASIVFAIMATMAVKTENDIFHIVFMIVLFSILSATTPDFVEGVTLVEIHLDSESKYTDKLLSEIPKKRNELVIMIQRNDQIIIPNGNVRLEAGDLLVINRTANSGL